MSYTHTFVCLFYSVLWVKRVKKFELSFSMFTLSALYQIDLYMYIVRYAVVFLFCITLFLLPCIW